jgi:hypothetical protein
MALLCLFVHNRLHSFVIHYLMQGNVVNCYCFVTMVLGDCKLLILSVYCCILVLIGLMYHALLCN